MEPHQHGRDARTGKEGAMPDDDQQNDNPPPDNPEPDPGPAPEPAPEDQGDPDALGDAGKKALDAERTARREAERQLQQFRTEMDQFKSGIAKALGLNGDGDEPDPDELQQALATRDAENRRLRVINALGDVLIEHEADPLLTRAVLRENGILDDLDPDADDFTDKLNEAVKTAVENNPKLRTGHVPSGAADQGARGGDDIPIDVSPGAARLRHAYAKTSKPK